ncbi:NADPH:quinone reductase [Duganella sp. CF402]|uniref:zinc-dependent alcohol dehydrogenase family protein n=1 Tax=unclassified Duganella TaxID=2636909 RepID=UPI0008C05ACB|nr:MULTISPECIES: zinc-dependent alcohol dehydrogenase family protein [unclassified Duganella]RZT10454.1 NADPH:quinone reductase-like Zn-dependent oxidoreductase [Duganella sp. BK701]SEL12487.1 NADPH:quinone reductase [Duganella sp. CF402]
MKQTMKAAVLNAFEAPLALSEVERPVAAKGQVLVKIMASGVNPLDIKIAGGKADHANVTLPAILGIDMAGVVEAVGEGVTGFAPGDEVWGMTGGVGGVQGSLAQYAAVDADLLAHKPTSISMREAAALPLVFITAWEGLVDRAKVGPGMKVLVHGGAGGVGHIAVQLARAYGADVYATGSAAQRATIEGYGATFIDYQASTVDEYVRQHTGGEGFDIVYDTVGGATLDASFAAAKRYHGHVVSCLGWGTHALAPLSFRAATYSGVFTLLPLLSGFGRANHGAIMTAAAKLVDDGKISVLMDAQRYALADVGKAHAALQAGTARGKVVVEVA